MISALDKNLSEYIQKRSGLFNVLVSLLLTAAVLLIHIIGPAFHGPYWLDEAFVALSTRYPISDLHQVAASTPAGFLLLLRLVPSSRDLRIVPLVFLILTVIGGYWFGLIAYGKRDTAAVRAGLLVALFLIFAPFLVGAIELKQYMADAFVATFVLLCCLKLDAGFSTRKVAVFGFITLACMTISHTVVFVAAAAFIAIIINLLISGASKRAIVSCCGIFVLSLGAYLAYYTVVDKQGRSAALTNSWNSFFPAVSQLPRYVTMRLKYLAPFHNLGMGLILLTLFGLGIAKLFQLNKKITATTIVTVFFIAMLAGVTRTYPLLNQRTSIYLLTIITITIALGTIRAIELSSGLLAQYFGFVLCVSVILFLIVYSLPIMATYPLEDTRDTSRYVHDHFRKGDIIMVSLGASYGFSFYWPERPGLCHPPPSNTLNFIPCYPDAPIIILPQHYTSEQLTHEEAVSEQGLSKGHSLWLVGAHLSYPEKLAVNKWVQTGYLAYYQGNSEVIKFQK